MRLLLLFTWVLTAAAGWTFLWAWSSAAELRRASAPSMASRSSLTPGRGAPIRSVPGSSVPDDPRPAPIDSYPPHEDGSAIDFERLAFDDYDPPGLRELSDPLGPNGFPPAARSLEGKRLSIVGFSQTLQIADGRAERLMVSRYPPGCCFGTVPVFDEWILVELSRPVDVVELPSLVRVTGTLSMGETLTADGAVESLYRMTTADIEAY